MKYEYIELKNASLEELNEYGKNGWRVVTIAKECPRGSEDVSHFMEKASKEGNY